MKLIKKPGRLRVNLCCCVVVYDVSRRTKIWAPAGHEHRRRAPLTGAGRSSTNVGLVGERIMGASW